MRISFFIVLICLATTGCAKMKGWLPSSPKKHQTRATAKPVAPLYPALSNPGKIAMVNRQVRFVVLTFPVGAVPGIAQKLNVYRNGSKVGEVKVAGPQRDNDTVADIITGELQVNDEVRPD